MKRITKLKYDQWPKLLQRKEVLGVFVGGCWRNHNPLLSLLKKHDMLGYIKKDGKEAFAFAHSHVGTVWPLNRKGIICFLSENTMSDMVQLHELTHILLGATKENAEHGQEFWTALWKLYCANKSQ